MPDAAGPSWISLAHRSATLLGLIASAGWLYARANLAQRGWLPASPERLAASRLRFARRFVSAATRFRGGLIKIGQVASLRIDVVPDDVTEELARLQDRVEPHAFDEIARQLEAELGRPVSDSFRSFEAEPIAAASLGQVHRARALDGRDLAVKVLYPGIERSVAIDLAMTRLALALFNPLSVADLRYVHRQIRDALHGEMDYVAEGRAAEEIGCNLAGEAELAARVRVPTIYWDLTTRRVLAMEYIEGVKINDTAALEASGIDGREVAQLAARAFLHMMFRHGFFHCDPHPGNLLIEPDGRLGIIDFGMNERVSPRLLDAVRKNVMASVARDARMYAESLVEGEMVDPRDVPAVIELAELSFDPKFYNLTPSEFASLDFADYFRQMRSSMKRLHSFRLPDGVVMWSRAISVLFGLLSELAPGIRPLDILGPYVLEFLQGGPAGVNPNIPDASNSA